MEWVGFFVGGVLGSGNDFVYVEEGDYFFGFFGCYEFCWNVEFVLYCYVFFEGFDFFVIVE